MLSLTLAALVFSLGILTSAPSAHAELHEDSDHADHECAITLFAHGAEPVQTAAFAIGRDATFVFEAQTAPESVGFPEPEHLRPPAAGPPAA